MMTRMVLTCLTIALTGGLAGGALAQQNKTEEQRSTYYDSFPGKKVVFVPMSMGFDLTELWAAQMRNQAHDLGYSFDIRDPNWSSDAGSKAITALITEKPNIVVVQNLDVQVYARLLKRANDAGIKVLQVNMMSLQQTDSYVGVDYVKLAEREAEALVERCAAPNAISHKVALIYSSPTDSGTVFHRAGWHKVLDAHPEIQIVAEQAANADPSKARGVMETILQQHADLCGVVGVWDGQDSGVGAALQQANKTGQVLMITSGGGTKEACDGIDRGLYGLYFSYDAPRIGSLLNEQIAEVLQSSAGAGTTKVSYYVPLTPATKQSISSLSCWRLEQYNK
jgi:ribose transport system substrate-binding protein